MPFFKNIFFRIFLGLALGVYLLIEAQGKGDLFIYYCAAVDLANGVDIYTANYQDGFHYYYSVAFAWFLSLFKTLPFYGIKFCWLLLNTSLYLHLFSLLKRSALVQLLSQKQQDYFLLTVFVFSFRFFHQNIHASQISIIILWCCIYGLICIQKERSLKGSAILALGINIKLLPLVILPYLIYRGYFKACVLTCMIYVGLLFLPVLFIGSSYNASLLVSWFHSLNPTNQQHILDTDERSFHSLSTLLSTLFYANPPDPLAMSLKRNIADLPLENLKFLIFFVRATLVAMSLYFLKWPPFTKAGSRFQNIIELSYILLLIPLIFPHQQHYAFVFSVPAFAVICFYYFYYWHNISILKKRIGIVLLSLIYLTANLSMLLGEFNRYYEHYKILTYGALLLIPLLMAISRSKNIKDFSVN